MRTWDLTSAIVANEPISEYFNLGVRGNVVVQNDGRTIFTANPNGKVRSLGYSWDYTLAEKQKMIDRMIELISQPPGTSNSSTIAIYARGNTGAEKMSVTVNGETLDSWNNIQSDNNYSTYEVTLVNEMTINSIRVNSISGEAWPHAIIVDKIVVDGTTYQSEADNTLSNGAWTENTGCAEGYKYSEWLSCPNAWFEYKLDGANREGVDNRSNEYLQVYPNPTLDVLNILLDLESSDEVGTIQLINLNGRVLIEEELMLSNSNEFQLDLNDIASGIYLLQINTREQILKQKVVKY